MPKSKFSKYKKSVFFAVSAICIFILLNFAIWKIWTEELLTSSSGDLARLSYSTDVKSYRQNIDNLPLRHLSMDKYSGQEIDVLTVGDSFSQGGGGGLNRFYQDHIASISKVTVLNVHPYEKRLDNGMPVDSLGPVRTLIVLINSGILDRIKPKYIVLQSVQRAVGLRLAGQLDFSEKAELNNLMKFYGQDPNRFYNNQQKLFFINNGNIKVLYNKLVRNFSNKDIGGVRRERLKVGLFDCNTPDVLLFLKDDVTTIPSNSGQAVAAKINSNLNQLALLLQQRGIKLYFMPVVDKYELYADYILGNRYGRSDFFEQMRTQNKKYSFIDTKYLLGDLLRNGVKDVYYVDDTHWSWKASNAIFTSVKFSAR